MRTSVWTCLALCGATRAWSATMPSGLEAVVLPPEAQVARQTEAQGAASLHLRAARGEREPAMVVIRAGASGLLTARVSALSGPHGETIPSSSVELDRVGWSPTPRGELPDTLEPCEGPLPVRSDENLLLWVEVAVPREAAPGHYRGQLELKTSQAARTVPIEVEVLPLTLPRTPSLATSFPPDASGAAGAFARAALKERVTLRVARPPPFQMRRLEGTLALDFSEFDRDLAPLRLDGDVRASSVALEVPEGVPAPRRLEYLLAVKRHLAQRGMGDLLVSFGEDGRMLGGVQGHAPGIALVAAHDDGPRMGLFWWRLGRGPASDDDGTTPRDDSGSWLERGTHGYRVRSLGWAAFHAGAVGLYARDPVALLDQSASGEPRPDRAAQALAQGPGGLRALDARRQARPGACASARGQGPRAGLRAAGPASGLPGRARRGAAPLRPRAGDDHALSDRRGRLWAWTPSPAQPAAASCASPSPARPAARAAAGFGSARRRCRRRARACGSELVAATSDAPRDCPACRTPMTAYRSALVEIDSCETCTGTFLDRGELGILVNAHRPAAKPKTFRCEACERDLPRGEAVIGAEKTLCPLCAEREQTLHAPDRRRQTELDAAAATPTSTRPSRRTARATPAPGSTSAARSSASWAS